jgi:hypothetical protein
MPGKCGLCASMYENEGGMETKKGKLLSRFGKLYWKKNVLKLGFCCFCLSPGNLRQKEISLFFFTYISLMVLLNDEYFQNL